MHNYDSGALGSTHQAPYGGPEKDSPEKHSMLSLIAMVVVIAVTAVIGLTITFWALHFLFDLAGWILRVAVLAAVAAFVWSRVNRRLSRDRA
jgi:hypothetical protein